MVVAVVVVVVVAVAVVLRAECEPFSSNMLSAGDGGKLNWATRSFGFLVVLGADSGN